MKKVFVILAFLLSLKSYASSEQVEKKYVAELPNGVTVELIGVAYHKIDKGPKLWWRPDGQTLPDEPYRNPSMYSSGSAEYSIREIAMRISGAEDYSSVAFSSLGRSNTPPGVPSDANNIRMPELRSFICKFGYEKKEDAIRFGISTEPWQKVEEWRGAWSQYEPEIMAIESKNPLIFTWPRKEKRGAIIVELTHRYIDEASRMLMYDIEDKVHEERDSLHTKGDGLVKHLYWFRGTPLDNIKKFEFQKRPYQWIEFRNVSLEPDHMTNVEVKVLSAKEKKSQGLAISEREKENLGYILSKLSKNMQFPEKGRAKYQLEEYSADRRNPRVLNCEYVFDSIYYKFFIVGEDSGDFNDKRYFDGQRTIFWPIRNRNADIRDNRRQNTPIYSLEWAMPKDIIEELLTHNVELMGSYEIKGTPCFMLISVMSSKDKLKVWVAKEPDIYPVRIERLENDNLRYVYEFENLRLWNGVVFPEIIRKSSYKSDENVRHIPLESYTLSIKSFTPNIEVASSEFIPDFPSDVSTSKYILDKAQVSEIAPTIPAKYLRSLDNIEIKFNIEQAKNKMMLICFFDLEQRPSRNCVLELSKKAKELKEKNIEIIAIHTANVEQEYLDKWLEENSIDFPVGIIKEDEEQTRFNWGVKALPWLILTDENHIVTDEGFSINELDEKIKH